MSYQHFYSRVPARVSLFNKRDGFDTFAHSSGIDKAFVLGQLACVYENKLEIQEPLRIMRGEIPPVYSQILLPSGMLAQTTTSYIPSDFTGERSAYLSHTLILTDEERANVMHSVQHDCFNRINFITDIKRFNLTSPSAAGNPSYPASAYIPKPISDHRLTVSSYNPEMMKSFIYSIIRAVCEGGRAVYFRLPVADSHASRTALSLMNAIMSVLPYDLREKMSFVSLVNDISAYPEFKIKCVGTAVKDVPKEAGLFYDFAAGIYNADHSEYEKNYAMISFLYSLFEYGRIREDFLPYIERICERYPSLLLNLNTLRELVFLYWQVCGFYVETSVIPDDEALCRFMDVYERYREGLIVDHRVHAYSPLGKYHAQHIAIPDSVFSRLSRLYPAECVEAKEAALHALLKLIHVDLMRDSIFCFITRYYDGEIDRIKAVINENLSRVFYGGFLQQGILVFFDTHFRAEPEETRDLIVDKLLLSVRTPEIQRQIVMFLDRHYPAFTDAQKKKVCTTCLEMLPECDLLAALLVSLINRRVARESGEILAVMERSLTDMVAAMLIKGDGRLAAIFADNSGLCEQLLFKYVLASGVGIEILTHVLAAMPAYKRGDKLLRASKMTNNTAAYLDLITRIAYIPVVVAPSGLKDMLRLDRMAAINLGSDMLHAFRERVIYPVIGYTFADAFRSDYGSDGLAELVKYAENNPLVAGSPAYRLIINYQELERKCCLGETEGTFRIAALLPESEQVRKNIGEYISIHSYKPDSQDNEIACTYRLLINYLTTGRFGFDGVYSEFARRYEDSYTEKGGLVGGINADRRGAADAIALIISRASEICDASDSLARVALADACGLRVAIESFVAEYGIGAGILLKKITKEANADIDDMVDDAIDKRNASIQSPRDAVDLFLRRK